MIFTSLRRKAFQSTSLSRGKTVGSPNFANKAFFQSTSLSRGKTAAAPPITEMPPPFNPLPSHEGRPALSHAACHIGIFQSTSLSRGKTYFLRFLSHIVCLSIHFPLTREDGQWIWRLGWKWCLSIHFPLTREDYMKTLRNALIHLSIHFPLTREDIFHVYILMPYCLSIHFPLTREDFSHFSWFYHL